MVLSICSISDSMSRKRGKRRSDSTVYAVPLRFADDGDDFVCIRMAVMLFVCLFCAWIECGFELVTILRFVYSRYDFCGTRPMRLAHGEMPSSTDLRCFSFCFIASHSFNVSCAFSGAGAEASAASSDWKTCGCRVMSLSTRRLHTSSMPNGSCASTAHTCAWKTDCNSMSPSSSRMLSRSFVSTASMYVVGFFQ